jgi:hypothetical protein
MVGEFKKPVGCWASWWAREAGRGVEVREAVGRGVRRRGFILWANGFYSSAFMFLLFLYLLLLNVY